MATLPLPAPKIKPLGLCGGKHARFPAGFAITTIDILYLAYATHLQ